MDDSTFVTHPIQSLSDEDVISILNELPRRPILADKDGLRLSLAGAQDKLPVVFDGARLRLLLDGTPSPHILKSPIQAVEDSMTYEANSCLAWGRLCSGAYVSYQQIFSLQAEPGPLLRNKIDVLEQPQPKSNHYATCPVTGHQHP